MNPSSHAAAAAPYSHALIAQNIAESLNAYEADARLKMPKSAIDQMDAMLGIAKCGAKPEVNALLIAHVAKRRLRKDPTSHYHFSAALEAYALYVHTSTQGHEIFGTSRQKTKFVQTCMYRAERNLLVGFARDRDHELADAYFKCNPNAARATLGNVASRLTNASVGRIRLEPILSTSRARLAPASAMPAAIAPAPHQQQPAVLSPGQALSLVAPRTQQSAFPLQVQFCPQSSFVATPNQPSMTALILGQPLTAPRVAQQMQSPLLCVQSLPTPTPSQRPLPVHRASSCEQSVGQMLPPPARLVGSNPTLSQPQSPIALASVCTTPVASSDWVLAEQQKLHVVTAERRASSHSQDMTRALSRTNHFLPELGTPSPLTPERSNDHDDLMGFLDTLTDPNLLDMDLAPACSDAAQVASKRPAN